MQHFEGILSSHLMCTTCCTTRSLNRPFVSHPRSRVTVFLNYLLCCTTISIVSCRVEPWCLFKTHIVQLHHPASSAACGVGKHKQITNVDSGDGPPGVSLGLVWWRRTACGDGGKIIRLAHISVVYSSILCLGTFCQCACLVTSWSLDQPDTTDAATSWTALLQQWSSSAKTRAGPVHPKRLLLKMCIRCVYLDANVFLLKSITDMKCWYQATRQIVLHGPLFRLSICCWLCNSFHKPWCCPLSHIFKWLQ